MAISELCGKNRCADLRTGFINAQSDACVLPDMRGVLAEAAGSARLLDIPAEAVRLSPANPRSDGASDLDGLTASLAHGLAQRPTLVEVERGVFEVLTGERRVRAALAVGWASIPALVEQPLDALAALARRLAENLHRRELHPLDEARALKLDWLCANALALGLGDTAAATLAQAGSVRAGLVAVAALLAEAGWSASRPAVTQDAYLCSRGLAISKAALCKKLQILNVSEAAETRLDTAGLTEAGIRAFVRLDAGGQALLLDAIEEQPAQPPAQPLHPVLRQIGKQ